MESLFKDFETKIKCAKEITSGLKIFEASLKQ